MLRAMTAVPEATDPAVLAWWLERRQNAEDAAAAHLADAAPTPPVYPRGRGGIGVVRQGHPTIMDAAGRASVRCGTPG